MPKRKHEANQEEDSIETGNVDAGDLSDGDSTEGEDENEEKQENDSEEEYDMNGQEDATKEFDGDIQITPFNMKEELEEGHIDRQGAYVFGKRDKDEIKDHWLDNIDWVKVNQQTAAEKNDEEEMEEAPQPFDPIVCYRKILEIIKPGESILKALKRLGGKKPLTASERWKKKKETGEANSQNDTEKEKISELTELAAEILTKTGNMDIYQETFEGIRFKVQQVEVASKSEANCDMFGDVFEESNKEVTPSEEEPASKKVRFDPSASGSESELKREKDDQTYWEFKWENKDDAEVHGPHSTNEMQTWTNDNYFENGVWVRRVGQQGEFYSSRRVDFELYL